MVRRLTVPLAAALACLVGLVACGLLALGSAGVHARDAAMLHDFVALDGPRLHPKAALLVNLVDPAPYMVAGLLLVGFALARRVVWRAGAVAALLVVTEGSTQALKAVLSHPRFEAWLAPHQIEANAWPSGHSTGAMTIGLCAVLVAPPALRLLAAVGGGALAAGVGYSLLVLASHYPSDIVGGFLMAGFWTALAVAGLRVVERPAALVSERSSVGGRGVESAVGVGMVALGVAAVVGAARMAGTPPAADPGLAVGALAIAAIATAMVTGLARAA